MVYAPEEGPEISILDGNGNIRIRAHVNKNEETELSLSDKKGAERISSNITAEDIVGVSIRDGSGYARIFAGLTEENDTLITAAEPNSAQTIQVIAGEAGTNISMFDKDGNTVNTFPDNKKILFKTEKKVENNNKTFKLAIKRLIDRPIGISIIDEQHVQILNIVYNLETALRNQESDEEIERVCSSLEEAITDHFAHEEFLMEETGFQELETHRALHRDLLAFYEKIRERIQKVGGNTILALEVERKIKNWFINHFKKDDQCFGKHYNKFSNLL